MLSEPLEIAIAAGDVQFTGIVPDVIGRFPLELALMPRGRQIAAKLYYTEGRVTSAWAETFIDGYVQVAALLAAAADRPLYISIHEDAARRLGVPAERMI